jgi:Skp family chaperone for outer membrane proteins
MGAFDCHLLKWNGRFRPTKIMLNFQKQARFRLTAVTLPLLLACGFLTQTSLPSVAQAPTAAQNMGVGVVDEDKLADGYKKYKDAVEVIDKRAQSLDSQIPARELLDETEGKSFDTLIVKPNMSATENTQFLALVKSGMDKRAEYMGLIGKAERSATENARIKVLQDQMTKNGPALRAVSDNLLAAIRQQQDDTDKLYTANADSVVGQVAAEKKLVIIVRKKALVWSAAAVDITADVLARLNKA